MVGSRNSRFEADQVAQGAGQAILKLGAWIVRLGFQGWPEYLRLFETG